MNRRRLLYLVPLVVGTVATGNAAAEGDPEAGRYKAQTCLGCHASPGYSNAYPNYNVPKVGGQHAEYIVIALKAYAAGDRDHETMLANAHSLSDQDMSDIAAYFSSQTP